MLSYWDFIILTDFIVKILLCVPICQSCRVIHTPTVILSDIHIQQNNFFVYSPFYLNSFILFWTTSLLLSVITAVRKLNFHFHPLLNAIIFFSSFYCDISFNPIKVSSQSNMRVHNKFMSLKKILFTSVAIFPGKPLK